MKFRLASLFPHQFSILDSLLYTERLGTRAAYPYTLYLAGCGHWQYDSSEAISSGTASTSEKQLCTYRFCRGPIGKTGARQCYKGTSSGVCMRLSHGAEQYSEHQTFNGNGPGKVRLRVHGMQDCSVGW